jgi:O-antigen ligase
MEKIAFTIYLAVLVISPLLFGAVHAYAYSFCFFLILLASILLVGHNIRRDRRSGERFFYYPRTGLKLVFYMVFIFLVLQGLGLGSSLVELLSPQSLDVQAKAFEVTGLSRSEALAPYIYPVRMSLVRWTVYGLFFLGLSQVLNSRKRIDLLCFCLLVTAGFISVYGIYQAYAGDQQIWWFSGYGGDVRGTYINRNHFAGLMAMALMLATGFACSLTGRYYRRSSDKPETKRVKMSRLLSLEQIYSKRAFILFCGVIIGLGLVLSASRGGIISAACGLLLLGLFYVSRKSQRRNGFIVLAIFLLIGGYGLNVGLEHTIERFQKEQLQSSFEGRYRYAQKTMDVFGDYKLTGAGVGNFQHAYPRYQAPEDMGLLIDYAHNDWAQLLAESGLAGLVITIAGIGLFVVFIVRNWLGRRDPRALALGVVSLGAATTMGIHSWFDFNMHIPANVFVFAAILATGQATLAISKRNSDEEYELSFGRLNLSRGGLVQMGLVIIIIGWSMGWTVRHFAAETQCSTVVNSTMVRDRNPPSDEIIRAIGWDRYNAEYWYKLAQAYGRERAGVQENKNEFTGALEMAVMLNPFNPVYYFELGWSFARRVEEPDYADYWLPRADTAMDLAGLYAGERDPELHLGMGNYWILRSITYDPESGSRGAALAKAGNHYGVALDLLKGKQRAKLLDELRGFVTGYYPDQEIFKTMGIE